MPPRMPARKAEIEYDNPRPRDAALRRAANDNYTAANDNKPQYRGETIDSDFNESYAEQGLQPSVGVRNQPQGVSVGYKKNTSIPSRVSNSDTKTTYKGRTSTSARVKTSPEGLSSTSKFSRQTLSKTLEGKKRLPEVSAKGVKKFVRGSVAAYRNLAVGLWMWFFLQLPLALLSIVLFVIADKMDNLGNTIGSNIKNDILRGIVTGVAKVGVYIAGKVNEAIEGLFGVDIAKAGLDVIAGGFAAAHFVIYAIGLVTLMICAFSYLLSNIKCLSGERATSKMITFLVAFVGYGLPIFNIFPWFIFWVIAVWRYPK